MSAADPMKLISEPPTHTHRDHLQLPIQTGKATVADKNSIYCQIY